MGIFDGDRDALRAVARQYRDVAMLDAQKDKIEQWKRFNGLQPSRPMVMIDQIPWHEMNVEDELTLRCEDPFLRSLEWDMRSELYKWNHFRCDMAFFPYLEVPKVYSCTGYGIGTLFNENEVHHENPQTHTYVDQIADDAALERLQVPEYAYDRAASDKREALVNELVGDILPVRMTGLSIWAAVWDRIVFWRGATPVLYDLVDRPDFTHRLMRRMMDIEMKMLDGLERENLLEARQKLIHCAGAHSAELPGRDFDPAHVKAKNCWVAGAAQIFSEVSPAMHDEFEIEYMIPYYARFGLLNYGCCEPLHRKIGIIRRIRNVRAISTSPWADVRTAAEQMGRDFIMARKPNPSYVAMECLDEALIAKETEATLEACAASGTPVEFILKDITTVCNQPQRLTRWYEAVKATIDRFYS